MSDLTEETVFGPPIRIRPARAALAPVLFVGVVAVGRWLVGSRLTPWLLPAALVIVWIVASQAGLLTDDILPAPWRIA